MRHGPICALCLIATVVSCQRLPVTSVRRIPLAPKPIAVAAIRALPSAANASPAAVPTIALHGQVRIDAAYILAQGRGRIIGNNGSSLLMLDGTTMLDDTDIGILSHNGASILSHNGGSLISHNGGTIISHNGGSLISHNGGTVISHNGGSYRVLDTLPVGTLLPVEGMGLIALSLSSGQALGPAVATDADGNYTLAIPADQKDNVLVAAQVPGDGADDPILDNPRLLYSVVTAPKTTPSALDEDTALVTRYMRQSYSNLLLQFLQSKPGTPLVFWVPLNPATLAIAQSLADQLRQSASKVPVASLPALANRLADVALARIDLPRTSIDATGTGWKGPDEPAVTAMVEVMHQVRTAASAKMNADPHYFDTAPYVVKANAGRPADEAYVIMRPSDLGDFMTDNCLSGESSNATPFADVLKDLGVDTDEYGHLIAAEIGLSEQLALTLMTPDTNAAIQSTIREFNP